jgi:hypothetical protein
MTIRTTLAALLAAALALAGCGTTTTSSGTPDTTTGEDAVVDAAGSDTTSDTAADTGKDAGKDTVKADVGPPTPNWGTCDFGNKDPNDTCIQDCYPSTCPNQQQACGSDKACIAFQDCIFKTCKATPLVLPALPGDVTPPTQLADETTLTYCDRLCEIQAGPVAVAEFLDFNNCLIGTCMDCSKPVSGITKQLCVQTCGEFNNCLDAHDACFADTDCTTVIGCSATCAQSDTACQTACQTNAKGASMAELKAIDDCTKKNAKVCTAPAP